MKGKEELFDDGNAALAIGELAEAEAAYTSALEVDNGDPDLWHALAMVRYKQENYPAAIEAGLRAAQLRPNDSMTWTSLSLAYMKNRQIPEAEAAAGKVKVLSWGGKVG
jgi:Flp pilus assembly protein TadD